MNKLVRDRIPEILEENGKRCKVSTLTLLGFQRELKRKLMEEYLEFVESGEIEELGDIINVLQYLITTHDDFSGWNDFEEMVKSKNEKNGMFDKRFFIED
jgi:predicted house-cleaning noncanonical NTP pyrophosphatase (MazG superfamily)